MPPKEFLPPLLPATSDQSFDDDRLVSALWGEADDLVGAQDVDSRTIVMVDTNLVLLKNEEQLATLQSKRDAADRALDDALNQALATLE